MERKLPKKKIKENAGKILLGMVWLTIIFCCIYFRNDISVQGILKYTPKNPVLAAILMLCLFGLKSISIVIYSGILFAVDGILFPLPIAILMNMAGTIVMVSIPYFFGRKTGSSTTKYIIEKYPKAKHLHEFRSQNDFIFTYLIRMIGRLPSDIVSLYMGAVQVDYKKYLLGSFLGMLPHTITFSIMGNKITDVKSPEFMVSVCVEIVIYAGSLLAYMIYKKYKAKKA